MKRIAAIALLALTFSTAAFADTLRSDKHLVKIDAQRVASSRQYHVQIFEAEARGVVANLKLVSNGAAPAEAETSAGTIHYKVRVVPYGETYLVEFTANDGDEMNESMRAAFSSAPKPNAKPQRVVRGGRDIAEPKVIRRIEPVYTEEAKAAGAVGSVIVEVTVDRSGFVQDANVVQPMGHGLSESALDAVKQWQFEPSTENGVPVQVNFEVRVDFKP